MTYKIGIVGKGFVGGAMYENFKDYYDVNVYDTDPTKRTQELNELVRSSQIIFICVPTPMMPSTGACDSSIVEDVVRKIAEIDRTKVVVIKSTVPPGTTKRLSQETGMSIVFNPEFLTEANYILDFKYQPLIVIGADDNDLYNIIYDLYYDYNHRVGSKGQILPTSTSEAEMFKYVANCFLATKVTFLNEIYRLCNTVGIDYNRVADIARLDRRLGHTHWKVPGPDGKLGYGGSCFPKDMNALASFADDAGSTLWLVTEAIYINNDVRK
jgi:UDPglucose 6-dehydrogenase